MLPLKDADQEIFDRAVEEFKSSATAISVSQEKLDMFIQRTNSLDVETSEALRLLAVELENEEFAEGWESLRAIYAVAVQFGPTNPDVFHSKAISAIDWFKPWKTPDRETAIKIAADSESSIDHALELAPDDPDSHYKKGLLFYDHPARQASVDEFRNKALEYFEKTIALDPTHDMAMLYQAHCHHDSQDWVSAYACYAKVDGNRLLRQRPTWLWRIFKRDEQLALCAGKLGKSTEALQRINQLFDQIDDLTEEQLTFEVVNLDEAVELLRSAVRDSKTQERLDKLVQVLGLQKRYRD